MRQSAVAVPRAEHEERLPWHAVPARLAVPSMDPATPDRPRPRLTGAIGPYQVGELLGAGGMGEVYRARDSRLGRDVAVNHAGDRIALFQQHEGRMAVVTVARDGSDRRHVAFVADANRSNGNISLSGTTSATGSSVLRARPRLRDSDRR